MLSKWPEYKEEWNFPAEEAAIEHCKDLVKGIRNVRTRDGCSTFKKGKALSSQVMMQSVRTDIRGQQGGICKSCIYKRDYSTGRARPVLEMTLYQ